MGYRISQINCNFKIRAVNKAAALDAIKALNRRATEIGGGHIKGVRCWSWVDSSEVDQASTLEEALQAWRWSVFTLQAEDIDDISFEGEKYGDDIFMFEAIAPYVEDDSFIEMEGEEGERWRWLFKQGEVQEKYAKITYDYK